MSYSESQGYLQQGNESLAQGHFRRAAERFAEVVMGLQPQANTARPLTPEALPLVRDYVAACRGWATALTGLEHTSSAEEVLLSTLGKLRRFISNLSIPASSRALLLTDYKTCFYSLADFYAHQERPEQLTTYVQQHAAELSSWRRNLDLRAQAQHLN